MPGEGAWVKLKVSNSYLGRAIEEGGSRRRYYEKLLRRGTKSRYLNLDKQPGHAEVLYVPETFIFMHKQYFAVLLTYHAWDRLSCAIKK